MSSWRPGQRLNIPRIVVYERQPRWEPELERQFLGDDVLVEKADSVQQWLQAVRGVRESPSLRSTAAGKVSGNTRASAADAKGGSGSNSRADSPPAPGATAASAAADALNAVYDRAAICGVFDAAAGPADLLTSLERLQAVAPAVAVVVVAQPQHRELDWALREAGAAHVAFEPISGRRMRDIVRRVLSRSSVAVAHRLPDR